MEFPGCREAESSLLVLRSAAAHGKAEDMSAKKSARCGQSCLVIINVSAEPIPR